MKTTETQVPKPRYGNQPLVAYPKMFDKEPIPTQTRIIEHVFTHNLYNIHTILLTCSNCCSNSVSDPGEDQEG